MKTLLCLFLATIFSATFISAQANGRDSSQIIDLNQKIDTYVVQRNVTALDSLYASDFVFSHGTGLIEGKESWLKVVARGNYPLRKHDSVTVELHPNLAIARGKMAIERVDKTKTAKYTLKYIRVFALRNNTWQFISHITTHEQHNN